MSHQDSTVTTLRISGAAGAGATPRPVSGGIPFPPGMLRSTRRLAVTGAGGRTLASQAEPLVKWEDGSVKAALVTVAGARASEELTLTLGPTRPAANDGRKHAPAVRVTRSKTARGRRITVDTGAAAFVFAAEPTPVLKEIRSGRRQILSRPVDLSLQALSYEWYDAAGPGAMRVESAGPLRVVVRLAGHYRSREGGRCGPAWILRVEMCAGSAAARIQHTLVDDDPRSMLRLRNVGLSLGTRARVKEYAFGAEAGTKRTHRGRLPAGPDAERWLHQAGRPGSCETRGAELRYALGGGGRAANGERASGWVRAGGLAVGVKDFWQQFPKELTVTPAGVDVWLHTDRSGEYMWSEAPGIAKTHELLLLPLADARSAARAFEFFGAEPLLAAEPEWYLGTGVFGYLAPPDEASRGYERLLERGLERIAWRTYGWKHYGDKPSGQGAGPQPAQSFGNHHYEEPRTFFHQFLRTGRHGWFREGAVGSRHFMDIDVQHSAGPNRYADGSGVRPNPGPGFVWMHYSHDHQGIGHVSHFHLGGLSQYYLLTGDARAREVLKEVADHAAGLIETPPPAFRVETLSRGTLDRCGPREREGYWGQTRDQGWLVHLMHQAYQATGDERYPRAAARVIRSLTKQWRTPTPYMKRGRRIGTLEPPRGCWAFHWHEEGKVCTGLQGWGSAIVLMAVVEFIGDNDRLKLVPRKALVDMAHQNALHMARHIWDPRRRSFRYTEFGAVRPGRYWPNSIYLFPLMAVAKLTGDAELERVCRLTYDGPMGIRLCGRKGDFDSSIGMWLTPHYLSLAGPPAHGRRG